MDAHGGVLQFIKEGQKEATGNETDREVSQDVDALNGLTSSQPQSVSRVMYSLISVKQQDKRGHGTDRQRARVDQFTSTLF